MDWHKNLIVAAGKEGHASVFALPSHPDPYTPVEPVMSSKLHKSWIAEAQFVKPHTASGEGSDYTAPPGARSSSMACSVDWSIACSMVCSMD